MSSKFVPYPVLYNGFWNFRYDLNGANPAGWVIDEPAGTSIQVISDMGGHRKVVEVFDNHAVNKPTLTYTFAANQPAETVQFYCRTNDVTKEFYFLLKDGANFCVYFVIQNSKFRGFDGGWWE